MMVILILLILTLILYRFLFRKFGFLSTSEQEKREEAVTTFVRKITGKNDVDVKKLVIIGDREVLEEIYGNHDELEITSENVAKTAIKSDKFDETAFLKASEKAIVTILDAFSDKRLDILEKLLDKNLFEIFKEKIKTIGERVLRIVVISFEEKSIIEKITRNRSDEVNVVKLRVVMRQINYTEDKDQGIISGSKDRARKVSEEWTFAKFQSEKKVFWLLKSLNRCSAV
jgi:predicted lipid-binding transport protein (Tim44 family)